MLGKKSTHGNNILLGSLHNSSSWRRQRAWRGLVGWRWRRWRWDKMTRPLGCVRHEKECCFGYSPHTSFMYSSLNNKRKAKKSNSVYLYFWNHSLTFLLSKYIIYILLEYIKYRIGTIPFILPEYFYSSNCWKEQLVCNAHNFSLFFFFLKICWYFLWKQDEYFPPKIRFDSSMISTNLVQCNEWPSNNNTCCVRKCRAAPTSGSPMLYKMFGWKLKTML